MEEKITIIFGVYLARADAEAGIDALRAAGFGSEEVSVLFAESSGSKDFVPEKASNTAQGAVSGAGAGGLIGGALGVLAGIGLLTAPGIEPLVAGGPLMAGLAGLTAGGILGGITGALIGMGVPEYEAKCYDGRIKEGAILLSVHAPSPQRAERAHEALKRTGGQDISFTTEAESGLADTETTTPRGITAAEPI